METPTTFQRVAAGLALANAGALVLFQFVLTPDTAMPNFLFLPFTLLWIFGAAMLLVAPLFGALGTAAWGLVAAVASATTHTGRTEDGSVIALSVIAAAGALAVLAQRLRRR